MPGNRYGAPYGGPQLQERMGVDPRAGYRPQFSPKQLKEMGKMARKMQPGRFDRMWDRFAPRTKSGWFGATVGALLLADVLVAGGGGPINSAWQPNCKLTVSNKPNVTVDGLRNDIYAGSHNPGEVSLVGPATAPTKYDITSTTLATRPIAEETVVNITDMPAQACKQLGVEYGSAQSGFHFDFIKNPLPFLQSFVR